MSSDPECVTLFSLTRGLFSNITAFVIARAAVTLYLQYRGVSTAVGSLEVIPDTNVQNALFWAEKMRNMSGVLLVITALCKLKSNVSLSP